MPNDTPPPPHPTAEATTFLREILQRIASGESSRNDLYPIFKSNLHCLDESLLYAIPQVFAELIHNESLEKRRRVALVFVDFADRISEFPLGSRALNLEMSITCYELTLDILTREQFSEDWAQVQNNLAVDYCQRIRGERGENLERAIAAYQAALQVRTREAFPQQWAQTQNNLGEAYRQRIRGERGENLEQAIAAYQAALQVRTREEFPQDWAMTQNNLGNAYADRIRGERGENLERAIAAYQAALQVRTREAFPEKWADTQSNLVSALLEKFKQTESAADLDEAIDALKSAQSSTVPGTDGYVFLHYTLGVALDYRYSLHHNPADLEEAITAYRLAADTTPREGQKATLQEKTGDSQYQLGVALTEAGQWYEGLAHLEGSLQSYRQGQNRLARADALQQMARTHYLMGNFEKALLYFRDALRIYQAEANERGEANCRAGLGRLMLRLNFIDDAMEEMDKACTLYHQLGDDARLAELQEVYTLAQKIREKQPL